MHPNKRDNILSMDGPSRYDYLVGKVADFDEIWGLYSSGWATATLENDDRALPFWPEKEFAAACASGSSTSFEPRSIAVGEFCDNWLAGMQRDGHVVAVFPTPNDKGVLVEPGKLANDLRLEQENYE